ncbi:MAG: hypothetical protein R6W72_00230 [Desulfurivibrionaceae bacterium]
MVQENNLNRHTDNKIDGVAKTPIYCVVAYFCSFGIGVHHSLHPKGTSCGAHIEQDFSHAFEMTAFFNFLRIYQNSLCRFGEYFSRAEFGFAAYRNMVVISTLFSHE